MHFLSIPTTVNREIFVYENVHVLNVRVNKISLVSQESILANTKVLLEITVHVLLIKRLLATYTSLFCYRNS